MPPLWIGVPILAAIIVVISLLVRRAWPRSDAGSNARPPAGGRNEPVRSRAPASGAAAANVAKGAATEPARSAAPTKVAAPPERVLTSTEILAALGELAFEVPRLAPPNPTAYEAVAPAVASVLEAGATELKHAPRRPMLLPQLLRAIRNDEVSRRELSKIIARDPALAGNLLKLANSPFYRVSDRPVESIDRAVALLGTDGIRSLVATALVQPVFDLSKQAFARFPQVVWEHTYRAAAAAEAHAAIVEDTDPFAAQLLGLTMGLGSIVVFRVALEQCERLAIRADPAVITALLARHDANVARRIAVSWELSERIANALEDQMGPKVREEMTSLGRSLYFGRLMGALAVLRLAGRISDETAKRSMLVAGASQFQFESIWSRLTETTKRPDRPLRTQGSWRDIGRPSN